MTFNEWQRAVRIAKIQRDETTTQLAHAIFYSTGHVEKIISGRLRSRRVEAAISDYLGIDPPAEPAPAAEE